jgi:hypothetical protein
MTDTKIKWLIKKAKMAEEKKPKNQMTDNVIGKSKCLTQNKNGWIKHAKKLLKLHKNGWIKKGWPTKLNDGYKKKWVTKKVKWLTQIKKGWTKNLNGWQKLNDWHKIKNG